VATGFGGKVKRGADAASLAPSAEADGLGHHLLFAHPHAEPAEDAVFIFLFEALLTHLMLRRQVLDYLGLGARCEQEFQYHLARSQDT